MKTLIPLLLISTAHAGHIDFDDLHGGTNALGLFDGEQFWGSQGLYIERSQDGAQSANRYLGNNIVNNSGDNVLWVDGGGGESNHPDIFYIRFDHDVDHFQMLANTSYTWKLAAVAFTDEGIWVDQSVIYGEGNPPGTFMQPMTLSGDFDYITVVATSPDGRAGNFWLDDFSWSVAQQVESVPVPASFWLFGSGLLGLTAVYRRKACNS